MEEEKSACENFMNLAFTDIVKKVFEEQIFPQVIGQVVSGALVGMDIKGKYVGEELEEMAFKVHKQIMVRLFAPEEGNHEYGSE